MSVHAVPAPTLMAASDWNGAPPESPVPSVQPKLQLTSPGLLPPATSMVETTPGLRGGGGGAAERVARRGVDGGQRDGLERAQREQLGGVLRRHAAQVVQREAQAARENHTR